VGAGLSLLTLLFLLFFGRVRIFESTYQQITIKDFESALLSADYPQAFQLLSRPDQNYLGEAAALAARFSPDGIYHVVSAAIRRQISTEIVRITPVIPNQEVEVVSRWRFPHPQLLMQILAQLAKIPENRQEAILTRFFHDTRLELVDEDRHLILVREASGWRVALRLWELDRSNSSASMNVPAGSQMVRILALPAPLPDYYGDHFITASAEVTPLFHEAKLRIAWEIRNQGKLFLSRLVIKLTILRGDEVLQTVINRAGQAGEQTDCFWSAGIPAQQISHFICLLPLADSYRPEDTNRLALSTTILGYAFDFEQ
jgi:hypothetical protein